MSDLPEATSRGWAPLIAVVGVIALLTIGGRIAAVAAGRVASPPVGVDGVASVDPPSGWSEDAGARRIDGATARFVLTKGNAVAEITILTGSRDDAPTLAERYVGRVLGERIFALESRALPFPVTVGGLPGVRVVYAGVTPPRGGVEGVVTVAVAPDGDALVIDGFAPEGFLAAAAADLVAMAESADVG